METFFHIYVGMTILINMLMVFFCSHKFEKIIYRTESTEKILSELIFETNKIILQIKNLETTQNRSLLSLKEQLETAKPMKTNNWESIRDAFTRPSRVNNERD